MCGGAVFVQVIGSEKVNAKELSSLLMQLMQFQEDKFGKHSNNHEFVKLPVGKRLKGL